MMTFKKGCAVAALALALPMAAASTGHAAPLMLNQTLAAPAAHVGGDSSPLTQVQWRGRGYRGGYYRGGGGGAALGFGLAAGALLGGAIAAGSSPYYGYGPGYYGPGYGYAPGPVVVERGYGGGDAEAYCMQRYRSYDPASGTYLNYDGNRYPCP